MEGSQTHNSTSRLALDKAAPRFSSRRGRILQILAERGNSTLFEVATIMELHDHQISGRMTELLADGLIERTGERRNKPETGCACDVYRLAEGVHQLDLGEALNCPDTLVVPSEGTFNRQPWTGHEDVPGVPYVRQSNSGGVPRITYRICLIECDGCGKPIRQVIEGGVKVYRCATSGCGRTWKPMVVNEPGKAGMLAMVMTYL